MEFKPWPMTKDGRPKSTPEETNEYVSEAFTMPLEGIEYFSEREQFLMKEALNAGQHYGSLGSWLDDAISDGGHIVAQLLSHDAGEIESPKDSLKWFTRMYNSGYQAGHHDTVEGYFTDVHQSDKDSYHEDVVMEILEEMNEFDRPIPSERMAEHKALHIVRNPYGFSKDEFREARLLVCDKVESYKEAYLNMRDFAESKGIDTRAYGR